MSVLRIAALLVLLLLSLLFAAGQFLFSTEGLPWVWARLEPRLEGTLSIDKIGGRLNRDIYIDGLRIRTPGVEIDIDRMRVSWNPWALLVGMTEVRYLRAQGVAIRPGPGAPEADAETPPPEQLPRVPRYLLGWITLDDVRIGAGEAPFRIRRLSFSSASYGQRFRFSVGDLRMADGARLNGLLRGQLYPDRIEISGLDIQELENQGKLSGQGRCAWPELLCEAQLEWTKLGWPIKAPRYRSESGSGWVAGAADLYEVELRTDLLLPELPRLAVELGATGSRVGLQAARASVTGDQIRLLLDGAIDWSNPAPLDWDLRGDATLEIPENRLVASGRYRGREADLKLEVAAGDLARVRPVLAPFLELPDPGALGGAIEGQLAIAGRLEQPRIRGQLRAERLQLADLAVARVEYAGDVEWQTGGKIDARAQIAGLRKGEQQIESLDLRARGRPAALRLDADVVHPAARFNARLDGAWDFGRQNFSGQLRDGALQLGTAPPLKQVSAHGVQLSRQRIELRRACWTTLEAQLCLAGQLADDSLAAEADMDKLSFTALRAWMPDAISASGEFSGRLRIPPARLDALKGEFSLGTDRVVLRSIELPDAPPLNISRLRIEGGFDPAQARAQLAMDADAGTLAGEARVDLAAAEPQLDGRLQLRMDRLDVLPLLVPEIVSAAGSLNGEMQLSGALAAPRWAGELKLRDGRAVLDRPNITLEQMKADLRAGDDGIARLQLDARSGPGQVQIRGELQGRPDDWRLNGEIGGDNFLLADTAEVVARVSPQLSIKAEPGLINISGRVAVPHARIRPQTLSDTGARGPSADQILVGETRREAPLRIGADLTAALGEDVRFEGFGLKTGLRGQLRMRQQPGKLLLGQGEVRLIDGVFKAYGQNLDIERGQLLFSGGPLSEPGIDLRASRQPQPGIRVGLVAQGPAAKPRFSLFSDPPMPETDQLSYLVLGRAARARSDADQASLNNAAIALGMKGSSFLAGKLKGKLSLDQLEIGAQPGQSTEQAALVLGKYLSPDLYVSYGIGLFEPTHTVRLNYRLTDSWSVATESGVEQGGDILYTIER